MASSYISRTRRPRPSRRARPAAGARPEPVSGHAAAGPERHAAIEKAKLEWENTADALAALVCLLGDEGSVLRANRVVEDWSLGTVARVIGMQAHALVHPNCNG